MNKNTNIKMTEAEAMELLPWYTIDRLSGNETDLIDDLLSSSATLKNSMQLENKMRNIVQENKSVLEYSLLDSVESRLGKVLNAIDEESKSEIALQPSSFSLGLWLKKLLPVNPPKMQHAAFAVLSLFSIALMFSFVAPLITQKNVYYPATIETAANQKTEKVTTLLIGLSADRDDPEVLKVLNSIQAKIGEIPGKDGMYRIEYSKMLDKAETKKLLNTLSSHKDLFWFVGEDY